MDALTIYGVASIMGALGGVGHQLHDPYRKNEIYAIVRSVVNGIIASILIVATMHFENIDALVVQSIISGWFGDNVVLNFMRRHNNTVNKKV